MRARDDVSRAQIAKILPVVFFNILVHLFLRGLGGIAGLISGFVIVPLAEVGESAVGGIGGGHERGHRPIALPHKLIRGGAVDVLEQGQGI